MEHDRSHAELAGPKVVELSVDQYAELQDTVAEAKEQMPPGTDVLVLPGGGAKAMEAWLTCDQCGRFVCYKHMPILKPLWKNGEREPALCVPAPRNRWSRPIAERELERFTDRVKIKLEGDGE